MPASAHTFSQQTSAQGPSLDWMAMAEYLWCQEYRGRIFAAPAAGKEPAPPDEEPREENPENPEIHAPLEQSPSAPPPGRQAHDQLPRPLSLKPAPDGEPARKDRAFPVPAGAPLSLPGQRDLARALRPLARRTAEGRLVLDVDATVEATARQHGILSPRFSRSRQRWLELDLVVDTGDSVAFWRGLPSDVEHMLALPGAFRRIRRWSLSGDQSGLHLTTAGGRPVRTSALTSGPLSRCVLILTDTLADAWLSPAAETWLAGLSRSVPVVLLHLLPPRLWSRSGLADGAPARISSRARGSRNAAWRALPPASSHPLPDGLPLPCINLDATHFARLAGLLTASPGNSVQGIALSRRAETTAEPYTTTAGSHAAAALPLVQDQSAALEPLLRQFFGTASREATHLACLLAAAPLVSPVMRMVQEVYSPHSRHYHLTEILCGGLVEQSPHLDEVDGMVCYAWFPGVRRRLLALSPVADTRSVWREVGHWLAAQRSSPFRRLAALWQHPHGTVEADLSREELFFAEVNAEVWQTWGGEWAKRGKQLASRIYGDTSEEWGGSSNECQALTDDILLRLGILEVVLKWHTSRGHTDHAKVAEDVVARFLAALCGWSLVNLNTIKPNYPAADLGDRARRIAVQVTVNGTTDTVRETHGKAIAHKLSEDFDKLIILFLLEKAPGDPKQSATFKPCTQPVIEKWARPQISARLDAQKDESPAAHLDRLRRCQRVLSEEMSAISDILSAPVRYTRHNLRYASLGSLFVGRADTMLAIRAGLTSGHATAIRGHALHGMGGVGKTRAAIEYAWQFLASYTHIFMINADSPDALDTSLASLCKKKLLDLPEASSTDQNAQRDAVLQWLESHRDWLLILDNADSPDSLAAVKRLLPGLLHGHVLLTTRLTDVPPQFTALPLDVLSAEAAAAYLLAGTHGHRAVAPDDAARAAELAGLLGHLALALEQAAACIRVTGRSFAEYIAHWQIHTADALRWYDPKQMHYPRSLAVTFSTSVAQLSRKANELLQILAWFAPDPIPSVILGAEGTPAEARAALTELDNLSLARRRNDGSAFTVHRLVQEIIRLQETSFSPLPALLSALNWVNTCMPTETADVRTWPVALPLLPHAIATATAAAGRDLPSPASRLLSCAAVMENTRANFRTAEPLYRRALALDEKHLGPVHPNIAAHLNNLAALLQATNRLAEAEPLMRRALFIDESLFSDDHPNVSRSLNNLAALLQATNRQSEAEPLIRRALAIDESFFGNDHPNVSRSLNNLAVLLQTTNRLAEAEPLIRRALAIEEVSFLGKEHPDVARTLNNLGLLLQATNRLAEAEPLMRRALAIDEQIFGDSHPSIARDLNNLAQVLFATNRLAEAEPLMRRALSIDKAFLGDSHPTVARDLNNLVQLLFTTNRPAEAAALMHRAQALHEAAPGNGHPKAARNALARLLFITSRSVATESASTMKVTLNSTEMEVLFQVKQSDKGKGGFQGLMVKLQSQTNITTGVLELHQDDLTRIQNSAFRGTGGYQSRLRKLFTRVLGPKLDGKFD